MSDGKPITYENWNSGKHTLVLWAGVTLLKSLYVLTHIKPLILQNQTRLDKQKQRQPLTKWQWVEVEGPALKDYCQKRGNVLGRSGRYT